MKAEVEKCRLDKKVVAAASELVKEGGRTRKELEITKKALELVCCVGKLKETCPYVSNKPLIDTCDKFPDCIGDIKEQCWQEYFIAQAKEQPCTK